MIFFQGDRTVFKLDAWSKHIVSACEAFLRVAEQTRPDQTVWQSHKGITSRNTLSLSLSLYTHTHTLQSFTATRQSKHQIACNISERWPKLSDTFHAAPWNSLVFSLAQRWKYA